MWYRRPFSNCGSCATALWSMPAWTLRPVIVRNLSLNVLRNRHPSDPDLTRLSDIPCEETDKELSDELSLALESLPDTEQAVLRMKHLEGMETEEIAGLIQSTPGAVRTALSRARRHIRELYFRNL